MSEKKKILIIDDDESLAKILSHTLESKGLEVLHTKDGESGLKEALEKHPDLILLDIVLPKMDGLMLLKKLREDEWGKNVGVVALTNLSDIQTVSDMLSGGVSDYLIKSEWKLDDLVKKVKDKVGLGD